MANNPYDLSATENPYLQTQAGAITNQVNRNLQNNILPGISSGAVAAGGFGGSRQGVAEGLAITGANQDLSNALAGLYGNAYGQNQQYNLGLGSLGLQNQGQMQNFYTQQRGLDQSGAALGANLYNLGNQGYLSQGTGIAGIGNTQQQAPWTTLNNAGNSFSQFSGLGGTQVQTQQGSQLGGALGGAIAGNALASNLGFGSIPGFSGNSLSGYTNKQPWTVGPQPY